MQPGMHRSQEKGPEITPGSSGLATWTRKGTASPKLGQVSPTRSTQRVIPPQGESSQHYQGVGNQEVLEALHGRGVQLDDKVSRQSYRRRPTRAHGTLRRAGNSRALSRPCHAANDKRRLCVARCI